MTGYADDNRLAFRRASAALRTAGYHVLSPDELDNFCPPASKTWVGYIRRDLPVCAEAEIAFLLPGWRASKGATLEVLIFGQLGVPAFEIDPDGNIIRQLQPGDFPKPVHPAVVGSSGGGP